MDVKHACDLEDDRYTLIQNDDDLAETLESIGLPKRYRKDITGAIVAIGEGEYTEVWLCEDARYYELGAIYRPLAYYRPKSWPKGKLPAYWLE